MSSTLMYQKIWNHPLNKQGIGFYPNCNKCEKIAFVYNDSDDSVICIEHYKEVLNKSEIEAKRGELLSKQSPLIAAELYEFWEHSDWNSDDSKLSEPARKLFRELKAL